MAEAALMPSEIDIYRSAKPLVKQYAEDAPIFVALQADKQLKAGDVEGKAVWLRIVIVVEEWKG